MGGSLQEAGYSKLFLIELVPVSGAGQPIKEIRSIVMTAEIGFSVKLSYAANR